MANGLDRKMMNAMPMDGKPLTIDHSSTNSLPSVMRWFVRRRAALQVPHDLGAWFVALAVAQIFHGGVAAGPVLATGMSVMVLAACWAQFVLGKVLYLYRGRYRYGSFEEVRGLVFTTAGTTLVLFTLDSVCAAFNGSRRGLVPTSVVLGSWLIALALMAGARYVWRLAVEYLCRPDRDHAQRLLVFGAGEGGARVISSMIRDPHSPYMPVGLLDDDRAKRYLRILNVPMLGTRYDMVQAAKTVQADALLVAIPTADQTLLTELQELATEADLPIKILPPVSHFLDGKVSARDIREIDLLELVGRRPIEIDLDSVGGQLTGKRVLVTGAGGSIGSELCRQIHRYKPASLIMLDRDESALHAVEFSIRGTALLTTHDTVLADIRDRKRMVSVFERGRPQVVFHAAALKHLPLLQRHPYEAVRTNIWGTLWVLDAARSVSVERFVNISTDKAADPISVLGYSKRVTERLTAQAARSTSLPYVSVRFGNVLGSRGSVLPVFEAQAASGGPITVTHPDVTRYFMTIEEAIQLVVQAGAIGDPGEVLVLDMGKPARVADIARHFADSVNRQVDIVYTGLRPGEKLHEALFGRAERDRHRIHPLISHVRVPPLDRGALIPLNAETAHDQVVRILQTLCARDLEPGYVPNSRWPATAMSALEDR